MLTIYDVSNKDQHALQYIQSLRGRLEDAWVAFISQEQCDVAFRVGLYCLFSLLFSYLVDGLNFLKICVCDGFGPYGAFPGDGSLSDIVLEGEDVGWRI